MVELGYNTGVFHLNKRAVAVLSAPHGVSNRTGGTVTMTHSTRTPYFPPNLHYYAPWVARHGLVAPYGECQCGCGQPAPIAKRTRGKKGFAKDKPTRFIHGHNAKVFDGAPNGYKTCTGCGEVKPIGDYYLFGNGRYGANCKKCSNAASRASHHAKRCSRLAKISEYQRRNKEALSARERERRADPAYREKCATELREWRERNKDHVAAYNRSQQVKARSAVNKAVQKGVLPRPDALPCANCGEQAKHYHHVNGYERECWFDVVALCTECHGREHRVI